MESQILKPCRIDFGVEDESRAGLPVFLRVKPQETEEMSIKILNETTVETNHAFRTNKKAIYTHVFPGSASQQEVFEGMTAPLIKKFLEGGNVVTFAYGVTSSGKTHTIMGTHAEPGILPRTLGIIFESLKSKIEETAPIFKPSKFDEFEEISTEEISRLESFKSTLISKVKGSNNSFEQYTFTDSSSDIHIETTRDGGFPLPAARSFSVWISIYEIQNEVITDLLCTEQKSKRKALNIGQDSESRTFVKDLMQVPVGSASEAYALLQFARQNLTIGGTKLNDSSSRSHTVFSLKTVRWGGSVKEPFVNQLVISDLAGSERQAKTGTSGTMLKQAAAINSSLLVLGRCLEALRRKEKGFAAPFRESKLTRILYPFFTLGDFVSLIICINPSIQLQDETMDTIRFSAIASEIVQDTHKPIERLRRLHRFTLDCIENSPVKFVHGGGIGSWQDNVNGSSLHGGVAYLEVRASYFKDMARDILRAEKLLTANETEIESLKERLRDSEISKENVKLMYHDRMKKQRDLFTERRRELEKTWGDFQQTLVEDLREEICDYEKKYLKYRDGYAKLSVYVKDKLWPEISLFRERFGYLSEFPPKDGAAEEEVKPESTIKYWQDKLRDKELECHTLETDLNSKIEQIAVLKKELDDQIARTKTAEAEYQHSRSELVESVSRITELTGQLSTFRGQLSDRETLVEEIDDLRKRLLDVEERHEDLLVQHESRHDRLVEEVNCLKAELEEKTSELEETRRAVTPAGTTIGKLNDTIADPETKGPLGSDEETALISCQAELEKKVAKLERELCKERKYSVELQELILSLQDEVEKFREKEEAIRTHRTQMALRLRETRRTRAADSIDVAKLKNDLKVLHTALDKERDAVAEKNRKLTKLSEETRENREKVRTLRKENKRLAELGRSREQEVGVEFLTRELENHQKRILRDLPQTGRPSRRRRSVSSVRVEVKFPANKKPRRRLRLGDEESTILNMTMDRTLRDISADSRPYSTRSSVKR